MNRTPANRRILRGMDTPTPTDPRLTQQDPRTHRALDIGFSVLRLDPLAQDAVFALIDALQEAEVILREENLQVTKLHTRPLSLWDEDYDY